MDKSSKILIIVFILVILASIFFSYRRAFIDKDFEVMYSEGTEEEVEEEVLE